MTENYLINVPSTHLLSIFSGYEIEQPYRFQPYVKLVVSFEEYTKFVKSMVGLSISWLSFEVSWYAKALTGGNKALLLNAYYFDISKAILSEVALASINNVDATVITHNFTDTDLFMVNLEQATNKLQDYSRDLVSKAVESLKGDLTYGVSLNTLSGHNEMMYEYAILLRVMSRVKDAERFNIN